MTFHRYIGGLLNVGLLLTTSLWMHDGYAIDVHSINTKGELTCAHGVAILGDIRAGDTEKFRKAINSYPRTPENAKCVTGRPVVHLDSTGGDVQEAIKLGRFIRANGMSTGVYPIHLVTKGGELDIDSSKDGECLSSCVFVLAGGLSRSVPDSGAIVGIHRPYFTEVQGSPSTADIKASRDKFNKEIREYLEEVDINPALLDDMLSVSPEKIRILTKPELERYRLSVDDANFNESDVAKTARMWNLTSAEYRKRDRNAHAKCDSNKSGEGTYCYQAYIVGISVQDIKLRYQRASSVCNQADKEAVQACRREVIVLGK